MKSSPLIAWLCLLAGLPLFVLPASAASASAAAAFQAAPHNGRTLNVLLITADDLNHDSVGCYGGPIADLTPNIDRLASEGLRFQYAYSTVAVCQPVRQIMHTGMYPHRNGSMGFFPLKPEVRTMNQQFHAAGYLISMIGKNPHYQPAENFCVDYTETQISRSPARLAESTLSFVRRARKEGRPFFHHVNCTDPHRPFIGANGPNDLAHGDAPSRWIKPEEVKSVPGFLEDLPEIRREVAQYLTNVRRLDDCVGAVLRALDEAGARDDTLVLFYGGDHGMSFPFAKSNDYEDSSRVGFLVRWPGVVKAGRVDRDHMVATIDIAPTLLDATGLPPLAGIDGRSFLPVLRGERLQGWGRVFTFYNQSSGRNWLLMRCLRTRDRAYIWNAWADGKMQYRAENMNGLSWRAMVAGAETNPAIRARVQHYLYRAPEEFYDMTNDRYERHNLIADPARQTEIAAMKKELLALLQRTGDPLAPAFAQLDKPEVLQRIKQQLDREYQRGPREKAKAKGKGKARAGGDGSEAAAATGTGNASAGKNAEGGARAALEKRKDLIAFVLPGTLAAGQTANVQVRHALPANYPLKTLTVTMKDGAAGARLERKIVPASGSGVAVVSFAVPAGLAGKTVRFAAFVGEDFPSTPQQLQSDPVPVR